MTATWFPALADGETILDRVVNHRSAYAAAYREVEAALWEQDALDPEVLQLCRLRIAQLLGLPEELAMWPPGSPRLDPSVVEAVAEWPTSPRFDDRHRVCLGYAEQVLLDAQEITDQQAAKVIEAVGEAGFLVLTYACGFFETTQRARLLLARRQG